jgi:vacuolar-type H+-ATPase subunit H
VTDLYDERDDDGPVTVPVASTYDEPEAEDYLLRLRDVVEAAPKVPLSASSMIAKEEVLDLLDEAIARLPDELRAARWLLKERDEFLQKVRHEGDEIVEEARARAERFVQRTEIVKAAEQRAYEIVEKAESDARKLRHEVEDFCDQKLGSFEIVLERTLTMVASGRAKLQGTNLTAGIPVTDEAEPTPDEPGDDGYDDLPPPPDEAWADDEAADQWFEGEEPR